MINWCLTTWTDWNNWWACCGCAADWTVFVILTLDLFTGTVCNTAVSAAKVFALAFVTTVVDLTNSDESLASSTSWSVTLGKITDKVVVWTAYTSRFNGDRLLVWWASCLLSWAFGPIADALVFWAASTSNSDHLFVGLTCLNGEVTSSSCASDLTVLFTDTVATFNRCNHFQPSSICNNLVVKCRLWRVFKIMLIRLYPHPIRKRSRSIHMKTRLDELGRM